MRVQYIAFAAAMMVSGAAQAQWDTKIEDDIFSGGKKAMLLGIISPNAFVVADCDSSGELSIAYSEKGEWSDGMALGQFRLLIKVDGGPIIETKAKAEERNSDYFQITSNDAEVVLEMINQIALAKRSILVGIEEPTFDMKHSATIGASGSTKATKRFLEACGRR
jgi:hypothetical protein